MITPMEGDRTYSRVELLRARLEEAFVGSQDHSLLGSVKGVCDRDARWKPPGYKGFAHMTGSILNLLYHTGGDKHVLMSVAFGDGSTTWDMLHKWFHALGADLKAARSLAQDGHRLVLHTLSTLSDEDLEKGRPYYGGRTLTAYEVFSLVAEHDLYHAGQINYVRCLIEGRKPG